MENSHYDESVDPAVDGIGREPIVLSRCPIDSLSDTLERLARSGQSGPGCAVNCSATLDRLDHSWELFADLLGFYFADAPRMMLAIETTLAERNGPGLGHAAHQLRGFMSNFDAHAVTSVALEVERLADSGLIDAARPRVADLQREMAGVDSILESFRPCLPG